MIENNKVIIWGLKGVNDTMRFVNDAFFLAFKYMGYNVYWVNSIEELNIKNIEFSKCLVWYATPFSRSPPPIKKR